jgi:hypothetical protein
MMRELKQIVRKSHGLLRIELAGVSLEGREIPRVTVGKGPRHILFWSQMHGDESTATLALMDIFHFLSARGLRPSVLHHIVTRATLTFIPMLNPDGAERRQRQTAAGIDMNRDARALATPEARILQRIHRLVRPSFAFNLHDQELSSVGQTDDVTAIALLAPATDERKRTNAGRRRAMKVAAMIAQMLRRFAGGHIAMYDDSFEPRAFGDNMQSWNTSTILVESGHWPDDPEKMFIRRLNFVLLLNAAYGIVTGNYRDVPLRAYTSLLPNGKHVFDIIIRNAKVYHSARWQRVVDVGLSVDPLLNKGRKWRGDRTVVAVKEIGDLSGFGSLNEIQWNGRLVGPRALPIDIPMHLGRLRDMMDGKTTVGRQRA